MATLDFGGLDQLASQLEAYERGLDHTVDQMLVKGGKIIQQEWVSAAEAAGHRDESHAAKHMIDSIMPAAPETDKYGYRKVVVFPRGKYFDKFDRFHQRISFAKVAAILNYGRSNMPGSDFIKKAEKRASGRLDELQEQTMQDYAKEKGLT